MVHIPQYYRQLSSERSITMEFIRGVKINDKQQIQQLGIDPKIVAANLVYVFGQMIFRFGHIHCDAHPGNILVRKSPSGKPQIVLLDHGLYREISWEFRQNFSRLWLGLITFNNKETEAAALALNIHKHMEFLPLIFLYRTKDSKKKLGAPMTPEERKYLR
jgi:aarF domain-containing kinase